MSVIINTFNMYLQYQFVRNALLVGILIALSASLIGVNLVLKRFSLLGDGLSHTAFGVMCAAAIMNLNNDMLLILPSTILCAVFLLRSGNGAKLKGDAAIAVLSVSSLALGYLSMNIFSGTANVSGDVCTTLFGSTSILTLTEGQIQLSIALSVSVVLIYIIFYNRIFAITFDEAFAEATGIRVKRYNLLLSIVTAVIVVLAMKLVGSLLITALIIFPPLTAMQLFKTYRSVIIFSALLSVLCSSAGLFLAIVSGTPVGATIVAVSLVIFIISGCVQRSIKCLV